MIEYLGGKIETEFENVLACYWFKSLKNMKVENLVTLPLKLKIKRYGIGFLKKKNTRYKRNNAAEHVRGSSLTLTLLLL